MLSKIISVTLPHMSIGTRVVGTIALEKIDNPPNTKSCSKSY